MKERRDTEEGREPDAGLGDEDGVAAETVCVGVFVCVCARAVRVRVWPAG